MIVESPLTNQNSPFLMGGVIIAICRWVRLFLLLLKTFVLSINSFVGLRRVGGWVFVLLVANIPQGITIRQFQIVCFNEE